MKIREITIEDHPKLIPFWNENYFENEMDDYGRFKLFLDMNPNISFLAEEDGHIIGSALGSFDGRRGYLQKIVVDTKLRRQGIGQKLVKNIIDKLRSLGCTYITLTVDEKLISFYEQCGFKKTSQRAMNMSLSDDGKYQEYLKKQKL
jgi:ribosomal protein S18 acetylase RimI-like enzyme